jgi:hypothetical protein
MCCAANLQNCSQGCYNLTNDAEHCGACDADCGANRKCSSSLCSCKGAKLGCNTCGSWDFESDGTEGWANHSTDFPVTLEVRATPAGAPFTGTRSLAFDMNSPGSLGGIVIVPLCANAGIATNITSVSLYVYRDGPTYPTNKDLVYSLDADKNPNGIGSGISAQVNTWVHVTNTFADVSANYLRISFAPFTAWSGTIYIDQIELTP